MSIGRQMLRTLSHVGGQVNSWNPLHTLLGPRRPRLLLNINLNMDNKMFCCKSRFYFIFDIFMTSELCGWLLINFPRYQFAQKNIYLNIFSIFSFLFSTDAVLFSPRSFPIRPRLLFLLSIGHIEERERLEREIRYKASILWTLLSSPRTIHLRPSCVWMLPITLLVTNTLSLLRSLLTPFLPCYDSIQIT